MNRDVTVVVATLPDRGPMLRRALASVEAQTEPAAATIVETDQHGDGAAAVRNRALAEVATTFVAFLDDDDELLPHHLATCLDAAERTGADLVYPYPVIVGSRDPLATVLGGEIVYPFGVEFGPEQETYMRTVGNFIPVTHLCRTALVNAVGGFPEPGSFTVPQDNNSGGCEDYGLLLRLLDAGAKFVHVAEHTWRYHRHDANTGGKPRQETADA